MFFKLKKHLMIQTSYTCRGARIRVPLCLYQTNPRHHFGIMFLKLKKHFVIQTSHTCGETRMRVPLCLYQTNPRHHFGVMFLKLKNHFVTPINDSEFGGGLVHECHCALCTPIHGSILKSSFLNVDHALKTSATLLNSKQLRTSM
jgi:hypothetical protein